MRKSSRRRSVGARGKEGRPVEHAALILVDIQNDFCRGGALAVPDGDAVVPVANALSARIPRVIATQDFHPRSHLSFASNHPGRSVYEQVDLDGLPQVLWPDHCVQGTPGADFHPDLDRTRVQHVVQKGTDPRIDSYSGFFDNGHRKATGLHELLAEVGARDLYVLGLATDYCVKWTALDAVRLGYRVHLIADGCRGVGLGPRDVEDAIRAMSEAGVEILSSAALTAA